MAARKQPTVPAALASSHSNPPSRREFAERFYDVRRYAVMLRGGHFGAIDDPGLLAAISARSWRASLEPAGRPPRTTSIPTLSAASWR